MVWLDRLPEEGLGARVAWGEGRLRSRYVRVVEAEDF